MDSLYNKVSGSCSEMITKSYSTSFSMGIRLFDKRLRQAIYNIYGFVRFADEIVDTYKKDDSGELLDEFYKDTQKAIQRKLSLNPVLHAFQSAVHKHNIPQEYIAAFIKSMAMDLEQKTFTESEYQEYIYGSAEVVGLMCLKVFVDDQKEFEKLVPYARALGAAFQKINFLRDVKSDLEDRGRTYFPGIDMMDFTESDKAQIVDDIQKDFDKALIGIKMLPSGAKYGVYLAYIYYYNLLKKIMICPVSAILSRRIRIGTPQKIYLLLRTRLKYGFGL